MRSKQQELQEKMVLSFRIAILLLVAIVIQSSLQNKTKKSFTYNKDKSSNGIRPIAAGGHGNQCYTRTEQRVRQIQYGGQYFNIPYYVIVKNCVQF